MTYLIFALTLLVLFIMEGKRPSSKLTLAKKSCSVLMLFHSLSFAVYIFGVILTLPKDLSSYSPEKILGMKELGISFTEGNKDVNFLVTFSPKVLGIIVAILLVLNQSQKDRGCYIAPKQHKELLTYCVWLICLASCVVLSVVQLLLFGKSRKCSNFQSPAYSGSSSNLLATTGKRKPKRQARSLQASAMRSLSFPYH